MEQQPERQRMRGWQELGVVETIYEEEQEDEDEDEEEEGQQDGSNSPSATSSPTITPSPRQSSSPPPPPSLQSRVEAWSQATGCKPDVVIQVHGQCFHLHKDPIIASGYLKRRLTGSSKVVIGQPSRVTAGTFAEIAAFCYGSDVVLTPLNFAGVRVAAEWLEIEGLVGRTEAYLKEELAREPKSAGIVLRQCLEMLPDAVAATIAGRILETLGSADGGGVNELWIEDLVELKVEEFVLIAGAMRARDSQNHDVLYRIVDHYLQKNGGKLGEEERNRICYMVDCTKLSQQHLLDLVQNPRMPLRFIVQAMLVDQLYTRQAFYHRTAAATVDPRKASNTQTTNVTLGEILERDAALRQAAHIKASMEATSFRLESLERELAGLRRRLRWSEEKRVEVESVRSESFSYFRDEDEVTGPAVVGSPGRGCKGRQRNGRGLGRRLLYGLRRVFRPPARREEDGRRWSGEADGEVVVVEERMMVRHKRNSSFA
ncbi:hypothetical protein J5N97_010385 [Dioscorea zingiberensis]|uniref:NPH3 domain-containing protein n=1 Tax=Dioscorea zingiberensis TaxID=325984 RepID=A0A9D5CYA9_9LILI|nr:hypothetical protein J5N97_010385 [Dioscorea zingiberensis]